MYPFQILLEDLKTQILFNGEDFKDPPKKHRTVTWIVGGA